MTLVIAIPPDAIWEFCAFTTAFFGKNPNGCPSASSPHDDVQVPAHFVPDMGCAFEEVMEEIAENGSWWDRRRAEWLLAKLEAGVNGPIHSR
jgi:hypothetical protein